LRTKIVVGPLRPIHYSGYSVLYEGRKPERFGPRRRAAVDHLASLVEKHVATLKKLFDWLIPVHVLEPNSAAAVGDPTHIVKNVKTPVLAAESVRHMFNAVGGGDLSPSPRPAGDCGVLLFLQPDRACSGGCR
jgi:hypothetical protein